MPEKLKQHHENSGEKPPVDAVESQRNIDRLKSEAEKATTESKHDLGEIQKSVQEKAISGKELAVGDHHESNAQPILGVQQELKADAYQRTLKTVQKELKPTERRFSKVIHQPLVETLSNITDKTVARPSAILGGGITALLGSGIVLYMSKTYGFTYNTFLFFLLFVAGFAVGVIIEFALRLIVRKRTS